jgi:hypothetical protein
MQKSSIKIVSKKHPDVISKDFQDRAKNYKFYDESVQINLTSFVFHSSTHPCCNPIVFSFNLKIKSKKFLILVVTSLLKEISTKNSTSF